MPEPEECASRAGELWTRARALSFALSQIKEEMYFLAQELWQEGYLGEEDLNAGFEAAIPADLSDAAAPD